MAAEEKKFDPHALLPKDHPFHPDNVHSEPEKSEGTKKTEELKGTDGTQETKEREEKEDKNEEKLESKSSKSPLDPDLIMTGRPMAGLPTIATPPTVDPLTIKKTDKKEGHKTPFTIHKKYSPRNLIAGIILLLVVLGGGIYLLMSQGYVSFSGKQLISPTIGSFVGEKVVVGPMDTWKTYVSPESGFSLKHPANVTATVLREGSQVVTVFTLVGSTQKKDTAFYDGISLQFMSGELGDDTLEALVQKDRQELSQQAKITKEVTPVTVSGINGFTYSANGVGDVAFIYLPDGGGYLKVANLTKDPTHQGYKKIVEDMLSTFRFTAEGHAESVTEVP